MSARNWSPYLEGGTVFLESNLAIHNTSYKNEHVPEALLLGIYPKGVTQKEKK